MALWLLLAPAFAVSAPSEIPDPRNGDAWIADQANVIADADEARLNKDLLGVLQDKGVEVLVVTVDHVDGDPGVFATDLFREWSPGRVNADRGVLIVLVEDSKALSVNAGVGLMADLTDPWVQQMQTDVMIPELQKGDTTAAIEAGIGAVRDRIGAATRAYQDQAAPQEASVTDRVPLWAWLGAAGVGVVGLIFAAVRMLTGSGDDDDDVPPDLGDIPPRRGT